MAKLVADTGQYQNVAQPSNNYIQPSTMQLSSQASQNSNVDYFNSLPAHIKPMVNAILENRIPLVGKAPLDKKSMTQLFDVVTNVDPAYDATNFAKRQQTAKNFATGKQSDAVKGANQALYHMGSLYKSIDELNNFNGIGTKLNAPINYIEENWLGDPRQGAFKQNAQAVASELRRVFAGSGGGSLTELEEWKSAYPLNASEEQQKAYLNKGVDLLRGGIKSLNEQYQQGMGLNRDVTDLLYPESRAIYNKLQAGENPNAPKTKAQKQGVILSKPTKITNDDEYNRLPPNARFIGPDGVTRTKPGE
jgi:hypothetical protein